MKYKATDHCSLSLAGIAEGDDGALHSTILSVQSSKNHEFRSVIFLFPEN
jgi:hypothetical protein